MTFRYYKNDDGYMVEFPDGQIYRYERFSDMIKAIEEWNRLYCNITRSM